MAVTAAGRAHMEQLRQEKTERAQMAREERLRADLARLDVGWVVWSRHDKAIGGTVVKVDADDDGEVEVLCVAVSGASGRSKWRCYRLAISDIGEVHPYSVDNDGWRRLFACIADRMGPWTREDARLNHWAIVLRDAGKQKPGAGRG